MNDTMTFSNFWALFNTLVLALFAVISSFIAMYVTDVKVAHNEKNVFDNVINIILNVKGKTKDYLKSRCDIEELCKF